MFEDFYLNEDGEKVYFHEEHGMRFEWMKCCDIVYNGAYDSPSTLLMKCKLIDPNRIILGFYISKSNEYCGQKTRLVYIDDEEIIRTFSTVDYILGKCKFTKRGYIDYTKDNYKYLISKRVNSEFFYKNRILGLVEDNNINVHSKLIVEHECGHISTTCSINNYMKKRECGDKTCKGIKSSNSQMSNYCDNVQRSLKIHPTIKFKPYLKNISQHEQLKAWCAICKVWFDTCFDTLIHSRNGHWECGIMKRSETNSTKGKMYLTEIQQNNKFIKFKLITKFESDKVYHCKSPETVIFQCKRCNSPIIITINTLYKIIRNKNRNLLCRNCDGSHGFKSNVPGHCYIHEVINNLDQPNGYKIGITNDYHQRFTQLSKNFYQPLKHKTFWSIVGLHVQKLEKYISKVHKDLLSYFHKVVFNDGSTETFHKDSYDTIIKSVYEYIEKHNKECPNEPIIELEMINGTFEEPLTEDKVA